MVAQTRLTLMGGEIVTGTWWRSSNEMDRCAKEGKGRAGTPGMRGTQAKRGGVPGWWGSSRRLHLG